MAIIIGAITSVSIGGVTDGFQSVSWNINRQPNRLWQLNSWNPWSTQVTATITTNVTTYAGALAEVTLSPASSCSDSTATKTIIINATTCDATTVSINYTMYIMSYSYSKGDPVGFATESWSFQRWVNPTDFGTLSSNDFILVGAPTYVLQGRAEGSRWGDVGNGTTDLGITFVAPESTHVVTGQQGSVSAGFPGIGQANEISLGLVSAIGGGLLQAGGEIGNSSANVPHQPLYL